LAALVFGAAGAIARIRAEETALQRIAADKAQRHARQLAGIEAMHRSLLVEAIGGAPNDGARRHRSAEEVFDGLFFGGMDQERIDATRNSLENALLQKLGTIGWVCGLNDAQRRKLELAGRGDIKRFFDRLAAERTKFVGAELRNVHKICQETAILYVARYSGLHENGSLLAKSLEKELTASQTEKLDRLRTIEAAGGTIKKRADGPADLTELRLSAVAAEDGDLAGIADLADLQLLALDGTAVTDTGMIHIGRLKNLRGLDLARTQVGGEGLMHIQDLTELRSLDLTNCRVTDAGLECVKKLTNLRCLYLYGTQITDAGLESLQTLTELETLHLGQTQITDGGLSRLHLQGMKHLSQLGLEGTSISDAALAELRGVSNLRKVDLSNTQVTPAAIVALQRALPELKITK
jgi:uncharacterized protein YjbI with pentapeptide repeats